MPQPIFTQATKPEDGEHDDNITYEKCKELIGALASEILKKLTLALYSKAHDFAATKGIVLADTKFEFGIDPSGMIFLGDEALTPDSSRFWEPDTHYSYDKQFVRDWLLNSGWDRNSNPPSLPDDVVAKTQERYTNAFELITGRKF